MTGRSIPAWPSEGSTSGCTRKASGRNARFPRTQERKVSPDRWTFTFSSLKRRARSAPDGSGAPVGTGYHWYILAHQRVRKRDRDTYETLMEGVKFKVAHRRPHWRAWSTEYPDHEPERVILIRILEEELERLKCGTGPDAFQGVPSPSA
ncbi:MAG: hypothetical protein LUQ67_08565 [Methanomicrobiales archaeon]|nr:hypothetical protein [Methanomicrobiales archaeon]